MGTQSFSTATDRMPEPAFSTMPHRQTHVNRMRPNASMPPTENTASFPSAEVSSRSSSARSRMATVDVRACMPQPMNTTAKRSSAASANPPM